MMYTPRYYHFCPSRVNTSKRAYAPTAVWSFRHQIRSRTLLTLVSTEVSSFNMVCAKSQTCNEFGLSSRTLDHACSIVDSP